MFSRLGKKIMMTVGAVLKLNINEADGHSEI